MDEHGHQRGPKSARAVQAESNSAMSALSDVIVVKLDDGPKTGWCEVPSEALDYDRPRELGEILKAIDGPKAKPHALAKKGTRNERRRAKRKGK